MPNTILETENISRSFQTKEKELTVLHNINISISKGDRIAIFGPSGSGKSTLLNIMGLLDTPTSGKLLINGNEIKDLSDNVKSAIRLKSIGFIFQFHHLLPEFSALENVMFPSIIAGMRDKGTNNTAIELLRLVGLEERYDHKPSELSGGEQQRVALARALMNNPMLILADEPTGNLDKDSALMMRELLWNISDEKGTAVVVVSHNEMFSDKANQLFYMDKGTLEVMRH